MIFNASEDAVADVEVVISIPFALILTHDFETCSSIVRSNFERLSLIQYIRNTQTPHKPIPVVT